MNAMDVIADALGRIHGDLERVLKGLSVDDLRWQPKPDCNPIGWLAWHLTRVHDAQVSALAGRPQAWEEGWAEKFGRTPQKRLESFGQTPDEVAAFVPPEAGVLLAYYDAVLARTNEYLATLNEADLDRVLNEPRWNPMPTVGVRLVSTIIDCAHHAGEANYVRGQLQGFGWQKF